MMQDLAQSNRIESKSDTNYALCYAVEVSRCAYNKTSSRAWTQFWSANVKVYAQASA